MIPHHHRQCTWIMIPAVKIQKKTPTIAALSTNSATNKQKWDKRHSSKYCSKLYVKIARHLEDCHSREEDVHAAMQYPKRLTHRKRAWDKLRTDGDFVHNMDVFKHQEMK